MSELAFEWPSWLGTPSQFALFVVVVLALIKVWPIITAKVIEAKLVREGRYGQRITDLEQALKLCHDECAEKIDKLQGKVHNEALQRVQSEISLVHTLISIVPAPQLRIILDELEKRKTRINLSNVEYIGEVKGDGGK